MNQVGFGILGLLVLQLVHGQVPFPGRCPEVKVQEDFKLADYMGVWYEYEKYPFVFEVGRKCMYATYNMTSDDTISVVNSAINRFTGRPSNVTGSAKVIESGKLSVSFPNSRNSNSTKVNYQVLGTDYETFSVVYSCTPLLRVAHAKVLWVLTRDQIPSQAVIEKAEAVIDENKLSKTFLMKTRQTDCDGKDEEAADDPQAAGTVAPDPLVENMFMTEI